MPGPCHSEVESALSDTHETVNRMKERIESLCRVYYRCRGFHTRCSLRTRTSILSTDIAFFNSSILVASFDCLPNNAGNSNVGFVRTECLGEGEDRFVPCLVVM